MSGAAGERMAFANGRLATYQALRGITLVDAMPRTASGKMVRRAFSVQGQ